MIKLSLITLFIGVEFIAAGYAYGQPKPIVESSLNSAKAIPSLEWIARDQPYKDIENQIIKAYKSGMRPDAIAQQYKANAQKFPKDPVAQFAWVYAGRGAAWISNPEASMPRYLLDALNKADPGNVHEYTRYRFCLTDESDLVLPIDDIKTIGKRLLAYNPKDDWVRLSLINMLSSSNQGDKEALPYALAWVKQEPENAKAHSSLAQVYFNQWEASNRRNNMLGNRAIEEYQAYLRLAPPNDGFRGHAERFISHVQEAEAHPR